jgi:allantoicase
VFQARFRAYGYADPVFPQDEYQEIDLADVLSGGQVVDTSDDLFDVGYNLVGDLDHGWKPNHSDEPGHKDWVVIRL